jgi:putative oxygen-independent coproporphyrinogen III oxidase
MFHFTATPPLGLYIHIPWCVRKCPYCDFNSHAVRDTLPEQEYIDALMADLERDLPGVWGRTVETVFIGGGTPSLFSAQAIERLLSEVRARIPLKPDAEITLEANPGTVDQDRFTGFHAAGINRLSIGVQSFQADLLGKIGRIHNDREALTAITAAQQAGFTNINLDLMYGLPGQTSEQALDDLHTAIKLQPAHISRYELTIEPNTWFHRHPPEPVDDGILWDMQETGRVLLEASGYTRYEVSAYATDNRQCRHNLNYWQFGDYLGIGAGAHAKITDASTQTISRTAKIRHPRSYMDAANSARRISSRNELTEEDVKLEFVLNALRLDRGFTTTGFSETTGLPFSCMQEVVAKACRNGLLLQENATIRATAMGQQHLNELLQYWISDTPGGSRAKTG